MSLKTFIKQTVGERGSNRLRFVKNLVSNPAFFAKYAFTQLGDRPELTDVGRRFGTDKVHPDHSFNGLCYLDIYERYFAPLRDQPISILEIGVLNGQSLRTWKAYFPNASVFGIDIDPRCKTHEEDRIQVAIGSQDDPEFLKSCFGAERKFDIIIDDGLHVNALTLATFQHLFAPRLNPGGIYIIEDTKCCYQKLDSEVDIRRQWTSMKFNDPNRNYDNNRGDMDDFFNSRIREIDHAQGNVLSIHFWSQTCVILKTRTET